MRIPCLALALLAWNNVQADDNLHGRFLTEVDGMKDIKVAALVTRGPTVERFGRPELEVSVGLLYSDDEERGFLSIGPVWQRLRYTDHGVFIGEFAFAPTLLTAGKFRFKDMGGVLQFTTGIGIGWQPGPDNSLYIGLRFQHISNGSIRNRNPGMNSFGLEINWVPKG